MDTWILAHGKCGGVNEGDACACAQAGIKRHDNWRDELNKLVVADQTWVCHDILEVVSFEVTIVGLMKVNEDGHNLADA